MFLILFISLLYCLLPQLEYKLLEEKNLGLPIPTSSLAPKTASDTWGESESIFVELMN